jgi:hypothetical protein
MPFESRPAENQDRTLQGASRGKWQGCAMPFESRLLPMSDIRTVLAVRGKGCAMPFESRPPMQ